MAALRPQAHNNLGTFNEVVNVRVGANKHKSAIASLNIEFENFAKILNSDVADRNRGGAGS